MNEQSYNCTRCGKETQRNLLTVKKISFLEMGIGARTLRSRVVDRLCPECVAHDPDYHVPAFSTNTKRRLSG